MAERTLEQRVAALEEQMAGKTLEQHFREHGELIDRLLAYRFVEWDAKLEFRLAAFEKRQAKWNARLNAKFAALEKRFTALEERFTALEDLIRTFLTRPS